MIAECLLRLHPISCLSDHGSLYIICTSHLEMLISVQGSALEIYTVCVHVESYIVVFSIHCTIKILPCTWPNSQSQTPHLYVLQLWGYKPANTRTLYGIMHALSICIIAISYSTRRGVLTYVGSSATFQILHTAIILWSPRPQATLIGYM